MTADAAAVTARRPAARGDRCAYSLSEFARMVGKSYRTVKRLHDAGEIPGRQLGRDVMVPASFVSSYDAWPESESA